jgi:predicted nucleic acid-binding protein
MRLYYDTSVLVAALVEGHPHHASAHAALEAVLRARHRAFFSAHGLTEVYSVLTRTPFVPPVYPLEAWQLLDRTVLPHIDLVWLNGREYREVVQECAQGGHLGGRVHDLIHLRCARKAKCDRIYTFNFLDFRSLAPAEVASRISTP